MGWNPIDYDFLAYCPGEMLEVVDVFHSRTDPNGKYRSPLNPEEAIEVLRSQFLEEKLEVDPIILDLLAQFLEERGIIAEHATA